MTFALSVVVTTFVLGIGVVSQVTAAPSDTCGFSKLRARQVSDFIDNGAMRKIQPSYPPQMMRTNTEVIVEISVLIDKQGAVQRTCPVYRRGNPRPAKAFVEAAELAARKWKFRPNFGIAADREFPFSYVYGTIIFKFKTSEDKPGDIDHVN